MKLKKSISIKLSEMNGDFTQWWQERLLGENDSKFNCPKHHQVPNGFAVDSWCLTWFMKNIWKKKINGWLDGLDTTIINSARKTGSNIRKLYFQWKKFLFGWKVHFGILYSPVARINDQESTDIAVRSLRPRQRDLPTLPCRRNPLIWHPRREMR